MLCKMTRAQARVILHNGNCNLGQIHKIRYFRHIIPKPVWSSKLGRWSQSYLRISHLYWQASKEPTQVDPFWVFLASDIRHCGLFQQ